MAVTACCCRWRRTNPPAATIAKNRPAASQSTQIGMGLRSVFLVFFERLFVWGMFASGYQAFFPKACRRGMARGQYSIRKSNAGRSRTILAVLFGSAFAFNLRVWFWSCHSIFPDGGRSPPPNACGHRPEEQGPGPGPARSASTSRLEADLVGGAQNTWPVRCVRRYSPPPRPFPTGGPRLPNPLDGAEGWKGVGWSARNPLPGVPSQSRARKGGQHHPISPDPRTAWPARPRPV